MTKSGFKISTSATGAISDALISPGPLASKINFFVPSEALLSANDLTFKTISVTSSLTPLIDVNSCNTPSIWIDVTAVTSIQIDGVLHEFTSIKGVREDVTDIVLNVKSLALKSASEGTKKLILDAKGPGEIKASDIAPVADVEILNPDLVICNLDENTNFHMEMNVNTGKGYVPAELNKPEEPPLGLIAIDSLYSPVKKVSYSVSTAREGKALDYDKLTMQVETNGSISAEDAVATASSADMDPLVSTCIVSLS